MVGELVGGRRLAPVPPLSLPRWVLPDLKMRTRQMMDAVLFSGMVIDTALMAVVGRLFVEELC